MKFLSDRTQKPFKMAKIVRTGETFTTKSGAKLKMRQMTMPQNGAKLNVPQYITRQNYPDQPGRMNPSQWLISIDGVDFYARDDDAAPEVSFIKACNILYQNYGKPVSVLRALKASMKGERRDKNVLTGIPGLSVHGQSKGSKLVYSFRLQNAMRCKSFVPGAKFNPHSLSSIETAYNEMMTLRILIQRHQITTREEIEAAWASIKSYMTPLIKHELPADLFDQIRDNYTMRMGVKSKLG